MFSAPTHVLNDDRLKLGPEDADFTRKRRQHEPEPLIQSLSLTFLSSKSFKRHGGRAGGRVQGSPVTPARPPVYTLCVLQAPPYLAAVGGLHDTVGKGVIIIIYFFSIQAAQHLVQDRVRRKRNTREGTASPHSLLAAEPTSPDTSPPPGRKRRKDRTWQ